MGLPTKKPAKKPAPGSPEAKQQAMLEAKGKKRPRRVSVRADLAEGGAIHVRHHMSDVHLEGVSVSLADDASKPVWIQLARQGAFKGHAAGPFEMTERTFLDIIRNFSDTQNKRIPIDFEHASEADPTEGSIPVHGAPAQGWIVDLKLDGGNLWGLVEWGDRAREYIRSGQYRYFSPAIRFASRDRVTGAQIGARMTSGALTNNPFLDGLKPLAAKDTDEAAETLADMVDDLIEAALDRRLGDDTDETGDVELADNDSGSATGEPSTGDVTMADEAVKMKDLETSNASLSLQLKDASSKVDKLETELKTLRDEKTTRDAKDLEEEVSVAFATYKDTKSLNDKDREHMIVLCKAAPESFRAMYPRVAPEQRHLLRSIVPARAPSGNVAAAPARANIVTLADKIQKDDPKVSREEAFIAAEKQIRSARR